MNNSYNQISSRKNEKIIWASKLSDKKFRDRENVFFTEGIKLLEEALMSGFEIQSLFFTEKALTLYEKTINNSSCHDLNLITCEVYEKLSQESAPQGIFAIIKKKDEHTFSNSDLCDGGFIILEDIQNPMNLGAIFRCAYSLGGKKLVLSKGCADVYGPKALRSGMGSVFKADFCYCDDISEFIENQKSFSNRVFCTHLHSDSLLLGSFKFEKSDSIVIGNEGHGVCDKTLQCCNGSVIIPMVEDAESLNAASASSIIIWEMNKSLLLP